jgi:hypothetical protein
VTTTVADTNIYISACCLAEPVKRFVPTQVFRLKAEGYKLSRKARIKPFNTFSVSTTLGSSRDESLNSRLKAEG